MSNENFIVAKSWPPFMKDAHSVADPQLHRIIPHVVFGIVGSENRLGFLNQLAGIPDAHCGPKGDVHNGASGRNQLSVSED